MDLSRAFGILGLPLTASDSEVCARYRRVALACHPDKSSHPHTEEEFKLGVGDKYTWSGPDPSPEISTRIIHGSAISRRSLGYAQMTNGGGCMRGLFSPRGEGVDLIIYDLLLWASELHILLSLVILLDKLLLVPIIQHLDAT